MGGRSWSRMEEDRVIQLVQRCKTARQVKQIQAQLLVNGQTQNNFLVAKLVREFTAFGELEHARDVAKSVDKPNVYLWTAIIRGYSQRSESESSHGKEALQMYAQMHRGMNSYMAADSAFAFTLSSVLKACVGLVALRQGTQVHAHVLKYGHHENIRIQTSLISLYAKCGGMGDAEQVFDKMPQRDVQAFNTMIAGYADSGNLEAAVSLFNQMPERNLFTWELMITSYANLGRMDRAQEFFDELLMCQGDMPVTAVIYTAMITGYAKCGGVSSARLMFDKMVGRDVASWNAMISSYTQAGLFDEAVDLFKSMLKIGGDQLKPNQTTIASVVPAFTQLGSSKLSRWIRDYIASRRNELMNNHTVTALIDMHAKCGEPEEAYKLFERWKDKDMVCYSSVITAFGMHGHGLEALKIFTQLLNDGLKPDSICFVAVLSACSHAGLVDEGFWYFEKMRKVYSITPTADHYMCMVDLLGRAGQIAEAYKIIVEAMPPVKPHAGVWGALLSACRVYNNVEIGEIAAKHLLEMEPNNAGNYVLLSNIYAKAQRWDDVAKVRSLMRSCGMKKPPGCSWIEIGGRTIKFLTGNIQGHLLEMMIQVLAIDLKAQGYYFSIESEE